MYIAPNTNIRILSNVPLDPTYKNTLHFGSKAIQANYFIGKTLKSFERCSYQRKEDKKYCSVEAKADTLWNANYMMFQNTAFGDKWFYAFVKGVEYINNETAEIEFEIDVLQTWLFDFTLKESFVEREHSVTDVIGDNIIPEGLELGEYVYNDYNKIELFNTYAVIIAIVDVEGNPQGKVYDGIYGGADLYAFDTSNIPAINSLLSQYIGKEGAVVAMYMCPAWFFGGSVPNGRVIAGSSGFVKSKSLGDITPTTPINGYVPKNNKLYTYPYNFYCIDNCQNSTLNLRYEFFTNKTIQIFMTSCITSTPAITLRPINYKGTGNLQEGIKTETLEITGFPICSWSFDAFQRYMTHAIPQFAIKGLGGLIGSAFKSPVGDFSGLNVLNSATALLAGAYDTSISEDIFKGNISNSTPDTSNKTLCFSGGRMSITADYAKSIDDYFTMFGYACRKCKVPNIDARPAYNYTKTVGCNVIGNVPCEDLRKIASIFDNGVTFWKAWDRVGDYSILNNI